MNEILYYPPRHNEGYSMFRYPGGEVQVRLDIGYANLLRDRAKTVTVIARISDGDILPITQLINAIRGCTSADIKLILPYLPYARADRRFTFGDSFGLQVFAQILNTFAGVEIFTLDAHSEKADRYIRHFTNVGAWPIVNKALSQIDGTARVGTATVKTGILLPDKGAARYGYDTALVCEKQRDPVTGKLSGFKVPASEMFDGVDQILIVDDICDGGGTFLGIADELRIQGVKQPLYLYVTHGIFSKGFEELNKRFVKIITTDSFVDRNSTDRLIILECLPTIRKMVKL